ncbi:MAG: RNA-binding domain-containing protein [Candidatus Bathyarchaeia archaeon]
MDEIDVEIEVDVNPTEDLEKVKKAVANIFGNVEFEVKPQKRGSLLIAQARGRDGLAKFYNLLRRERIRDAARGVLFEGMSKTSITFYLNKQVAYAGHISFSSPVGESPLGPIKVRISCGEPQELIEWLAPKTTR